MAHGTFSGDPIAVWLTECDAVDRKMRIVDDFKFTGPDGNVWDAPAAAVVDGASIPRALWTVVGSPFTGDYRRASIVHDIACVKAEGDDEARRAADRMFFHACRAGGCNRVEATLLYIGVRIGAWTRSRMLFARAAAVEGDGPRLSRNADEIRLEDAFGRVARAVLEAGETDDPLEIERRTDAVLAAMPD